MGYFSSFVLLKDTRTRADSPMLLTLKIVKRDKTVQEVKVDITESEIQTPAPPSGGRKNLILAFVKSYRRGSSTEDRLWWMIYRNQNIEGDGRGGGDVDGGMMRRMWSYR